MPKYYQIHRGLKTSDVENKFIKNKPFFFSKKNSRWYNVEKQISEDYGGYIIYEIYIPNNIFTLSFTPRTKNKIKLYIWKRIQVFVYGVIRIPVISYILFITIKDVKNFKPVFAMLPIYFIAMYCTYNMFKKLK